MATFRFGKYDATTGANVQAYFSYAYGLLSSGANASSSLVTNAAGGQSLRITGSHMTFSTSPAVGITGGTVNSLTLKHSGNEILTTQGLSVSGSAFKSTLLAGPLGIMIAVMNGNDLVIGSSLADSLTGGMGNDTIQAGGGADLVNAFLLSPDEEGNKTVFGGNGNDTIMAGNGNDKFFGGSGLDVMISIDGRDTMVGGTGNDTMQAQYGSLNGQGQGGDDILQGGFESNRLYGGAGNDTLNGNLVRDTLDGGAGNDVMVGNYGADRLYGGAGNDSMLGGEDDDLMVGGAGKDTIVGENGNDTLYGGAGSDTLVGAQGVDQFVFNTALGASNVDLIDDMVPDFDKILLDRTIFAAIGGTGFLGNGAFRIGANATDASDRIIYNSATGDLFYDKDGNGGAAKVRFAILDTGLALHATDFLVIA